MIDMTVVCLLTSFSVYFLVYKESTYCKFIFAQIRNVMLSKKVISKATKFSEQ